MKIPVNRCVGCGEGFALGEFACPRCGRWHRRAVARWLVFAATAAAIFLGRWPRPDRKGAWARPPAGSRPAASPTGPAAP